MITPEIWEIFYIENIKGFVFIAINFLEIFYMKILLLRKFWKTLFFVTKYFEKMFEIPIKNFTSTGRSSGTL